MDFDGADYDLEEWLRSDTPEDYDIGESGKNRPSKS